MQYSPENEINHFFLFGYNESCNNKFARGNHITFLFPNDIAATLFDIYWSFSAEKSSEVFFCERRSLLREICLFRHFRKLNTKDEFINSYLKSLRTDSVNSNNKFNRYKPMVSETLKTYGIVIQMKPFHHKRFELLHILFLISLK